MLSDDEIKQVLERGGDLTPLAYQMVAEANRRGGVDNITVVLVSMAPLRPQQYGRRQSTGQRKAASRRHSAVCDPEIENPRRVVSLRWLIHAPQPTSRSSPRPTRFLCEKKPGGAPHHQHC